jgi:hypothetical protein
MRKSEDAYSYLPMVYCLDVRPAGFEPAAFGHDIQSCPYEAGAILTFDGCSKIHFPLVPHFLHLSTRTT